MDKSDIVRAWCDQRVGCPYIYGATGKPCTPDYRKARMAQYPAYADKIRRNCPYLRSGDPCADCRWADPETGIGMLAYDCAQLSRGAMEAVGIPMVSGANSQWEKTAWEEYGTIDGLPRDRVALVFRRDGDRMGHVGVYQGDGSVIHAKGHDWGVVRQYLEEVGFTHYGIPEGLASSGPAHPVLRFGASGDAVSYLQTLLCDVGETLTADGKFGQQTEKAVKDFQRVYGLTVDGVVGPKTWEALEFAAGHGGDDASGDDEQSGQTGQEPPSEQSDTVTISRNDWNAIRAAVAILHQTVKKYEGSDSHE
jgi:hypothetical protein